MSQNYKDTLHLPKTDFPMKADLVKREPERLAQVGGRGLYERIQEARKDAPLFVLHDGPPFANGDVHMGTALNKVLKDLIVKSQTMLGFRAPFVPGWDCHGLPIEFKVVKESRGLAPVEIRRKMRGVRAQVHRHPARAVQAARRVRRLGESVSHARSRLRGGDHPRLRDASWRRASSISRRSRSIGAPARRPRWPRRRWNTRTATDPAIYVKFPHRHRRRSRARRTWSSGRPRRGRCRRMSPSRVHPRARIRRRHASDAMAGRSDFVVARALLEAFTSETELQVCRRSRDAHGRGTRRPARRSIPSSTARRSVITADFVTMDTGTGAGPHRARPRRGRLHRRAAARPADPFAGR